jgi:hypothetical protein
MGITASTDAKTARNPQEGAASEPKNGLSVRARFLFMVGAAIVPWALGFAAYHAYVALVTGS